MSQKGGNGNYAQAPKYINDFSKALASEVRILLAEVGKLRDERRQLQYEISELMAVKSKHGGGGEYNPDWMPRPLTPLVLLHRTGLSTRPRALLSRVQHEEPPPPMLMSPPPAPPSEMLEDIAPARPGWRTVYKREDRRAKKAKALPAPASPAPPPPPVMPPHHDMPAWAQWKPNPLLSPAPIPGTSAAPLPGDMGGMSRGGLFGPPSPPPGK
ncbi:uncharacterized protein BXZ73DRAFT_79110 [Epithele typhae]|uniref:uncharacterized protein n=1 Tax=Epithele typhae TaxID=378194 RepID=UPI0020083AB0|nr:uncharacterized protein BXZ73DRAFT_79110 [Epithele typhae]KAH9924977.1 hypothetical protein BXZ73DRAFT_79110 [Epithele typhae]